MPEIMPVGDSEWSIVPTQTDADRWTVNQLHFMAWLALPAMLRSPKQQKDLAAELEVNETTLWRWKMLPGFGDEVWKLAREIVKATRLANIIDAQASLAESGIPFASSQAAEFVFKVTGSMPSKPSASPAQINIQANGADTKIQTVFLGVPRPEIEPE